jgi:hypothetical protein
MVVPEVFMALLVAGISPIFPRFVPVIIQVMATLLPSATAVSIKKLISGKELKE